MKRKRVLLAADDSLARRAVSTLVEQEPAFELVGEARDGFEALVLARELVPDVILMDINMPRCDGLLATRLIKRELPDATVVILTVSEDAADLFEALRSGAQGYLPKSLDPEEWLRRLENLARGERMSWEMVRRILSEFVMKPAPEDPNMGLTERERQILRLVGTAMTNRQVAESLRISEQTVKNHIKSIMRKLHLKNRVELALHTRRIDP